MHLGFDHFPPDFLRPRNVIWFLFPGGAMIHQKNTVLEDQKLQNLEESGTLQICIFESFRHQIWIPHGKYLSRKLLVFALELSNMHRGRTQKRNFFALSFLMNCSGRHSAHVCVGE
jgi:hypothetical protein